MSIKDDLIRDLDIEIEGLIDFVDVPFGACDSLPLPSTVEAAIITQGKAAANFNNVILVPLAGIPIIQLFLHVGQRNKVLQDMLLAGLEYFDFNTGSFPGNPGGTVGGGGSSGGGGASGSW